MRRHESLRRGYEIGSSGPHLVEDGPAGYDSTFTNKNCTIMAWNLMHAARLLRDNGGFPTRGNAAGEWEHVTNATDQNPEYRS